MLLAESLSGVQIFLLGLAVVVIAWTLRRMQKQRDRQAVRHSPLPRTPSVNANPVNANSAARPSRSAEPPELGMIHTAEVRLHDYAREVEGRIETRLAMLDQLVLDADREIARLEDMLETLERSDPTARLLRQRHQDLTDHGPNDSEQAA